MDAYLSSCFTINLADLFEAVKSLIYANCEGLQSKVSCYFVFLL